MNPKIESIVSEKSIAVVGVSRTGKKFGNYLVRELAVRGYEILVVHPTAKEIDGKICYPNLEAVKDKVRSLVVVGPAAQSLLVLEEAARAGINKIWLQQGSSNPDVIAYADKMNFEYIAGKCILMYAGSVTGIHAFHRGVNKIFGKY